MVALLRKPAVPQPPYKVRVSPRRTRVWGGRAETFSPSSMIRPESGANCPVMRLISVVLPAPFGPISAWRAPCGSEIETSRVTASLPKLLLRPSVDRTVISLIFHACRQGS
jgi:hypothetical protein